MSDFQEKIKVVVDSYNAELSRNIEITSADYGVIIKDLLYNQIKRVFAERYSKKVQKTELNVASLPDTALEFFAKTTRRTSAKITKASFLSAVNEKLSDESKEKLQAIIAEAGWLADDSAVL